MLFRSPQVPKLVWTENRNWINSKPLQWDALRGNVVLLDFWTYSCVNCLRTLPAVKSMWQKYGDKKLIIIGVHTPEFEFEKELMNVQKAVRKHNISYPILNDPDRTNWENYGGTYWPRAALINPQGELIVDHVGESGYDEIEAEIIKELKKLGTLSKVEKPIAQKLSYAAGLSPETYAGSARNEGLGSGKVCVKKGCDEYYDPGKNHHLNVIYLQGNWRQTVEYLEFMGTAGHIVLRHNAREVNVVLDGKGAATVLLNNIPLTATQAGSDIKISYGKSLAFIDGPEMYNLVLTEKAQEQELKIIPFKGLKVYAYTFG